MMITRSPFDYPQSVGGLRAKDSLENRWRREDEKLETRIWRVNGEMRTRGTRQRGVWGKHIEAEKQKNGK